MGEAFFGEGNMEKVELIRRYYPEGELFEEAETVNGVKHGKSVLFYRSGARLGEDNFCNGLLEGESWSYYESGAVRWRCEYRRGLVTGKEYGYHENGRLRKVTEYVDGMVVDSDVPVYDETGDLHFIEKWRNGYCRAYFRDGRIIYEGARVNNERVGIQKQYNPDGSLRREEFYWRGRRYGKLRQFDRSGVLLSEIEYANGMRQGYERLYNPDGTVYRKSLYVDDQYCGGKSLDYDEGVLRSECDMNYELPDGEEVNYNENGTVQSRIPYSKGMAVDGKYESYAEDGTVDGYIEYVNNRSVITDLDGNLKYEAVFYRNHLNGHCCMYTSEFEKLDGYFVDDEFYETKEEFLDVSFEHMAHICLENFADAFPEYTMETYKDFFAEAYEKAENSPAAQTVYHDYAELENPGPDGIPEGRLVDYLVREFVLRLRLPNDGETERDIVKGLKELLEMQ